jgi:hypothetical protein
MVVLLFVTFALMLKGSVLLIEEHAWKYKILGTIMIVIPITLLIATTMWLDEHEKSKPIQVQIESNEK